MARKNEQMKKLEALRDDIDRQIADLTQRREGVEMAIRTLQGEPPEAPVIRKRAGRSNVKTTVLDLLEQVKRNGLNATTVLDMAREQRGLDLDRGSVSSLLSRLKHEGVVVYDQKVYRLKEYAPKEPESAPEPVASVHRLRASGDMP